MTQQGTNAVDNGEMKRAITLKDAKEFGTLISNIQSGT